MTTAPFAVIFDADGVIFDSEQASLAAFLETVAEFGPRLEGEDAVADYAGQTDASILARLAQEHGVRVEYEEFKRRKFERYQARIAERPIEVFEGVTDLLATLEEHEIPFGIASSGAPEKIAFNLRMGGLTDRFEIVVSGEALGTSKPDPGVFLHTADLLGFPADRCAVIEDSVNGVTAAKAAGMTCVAVTNTFPRPRLRGADLIVESLCDLSFVQLHDLALRAHVEPLTR